MRLWQLLVTQGSRRLSSRESEGVRALVPPLQPAATRLGRQSSPASGEVGLLMFKCRNVLYYIVTFLQTVISSGIITWPIRAEDIDRGGGRGVRSASLVRVRQKKTPTLESTPTETLRSAVSCNLKALAEYRSVRDRIGLIDAQDQIWPGPLFADRPFSPCNGKSQIVRSSIQVQNRRISGST